jgi:hypothetical protein
VKEIPQIVHALTEGPPSEQKRALETYFTPDASFEHPFCRVPSFSKASIPFFGDINSRWVIWMVYRWYKILSPRTILDVHSVGMSLSFPRLHFSPLHLSLAIMKLWEFTNCKFWDKSL